MYQPVFQGPELFQAFRQLQRARFQRHESRQRPRPEGVNPHMAQEARLGVERPQEGQRRPRKIERLPVPVADHLDHLRAAPFRLGLDPVSERSDGDARVFHHRADQVVDRGGGKERLVALDVHVKLRRNLVRHLGHPVGPRAVRLLRHDHIGPEFRRRVGDPLVVGRHDDLLGEPAPAGRLPDPLDHGTALDAGQAFARETGRAVPRGDDDHGFHSSSWVLGGSTFEETCKIHCAASIRSPAR